jgi:replicative DNA helicase
MQVLRTVCDSPDRSKLLAKINAEFFGSDEGIEIYNRIITLITSGKNVPSSDVLRNDAALSDRSRAFISAPDAVVLGTDNFDHAFTILDKYRKGRILLRTVTEGLEALKADDPDLDSVVHSMESSLFRCHSGLAKDEMYHITADRAAELVEETRIDLDQEPMDFIPSSFVEFDKRTGGFRRKNVIAIASTPGGGKSAMAEQMAINQYMMGYNVCIVSYEMDEVEVKYRMLSCVSKVDHGNINMKKLTKVQKEHILKEFDKFIRSTSSGNRLTFWVPTSEKNIPEIATELKPMGYDIIYIDYLGLLRPYPGKAMWESLGDHARAAKLAANNLNAAMVLLCQYDDQENKLKYSKAITANAHFVWAWENDEVAKESGIIEIMQLKARNAEVFSFLLQKDFKVMTFQDYSGPPPVREKKEEGKRENKGFPKMPELS